MAEEERDTNSCFRVVELRKKAGDKATLALPIRVLCMSKRGGAGEEEHHGRRARSRDRVRMGNKGDRKADEEGSRASRHGTYPRTTVVDDNLELALPTGKSAKVHIHYAFAVQQKLKSLTTNGATFT